MSILRQALFALAWLGLGIVTGLGGAPSPSLADGTGRILDLGFETVESGLALHGTSLETESASGAVLHLRRGSHATVALDEPITTRVGTISFWVKPAPAAGGSQTYVSLAWPDDPRGYLVLSQGWWEPVGADRLYFVLSNTQFVNCSVQYRLPASKWSQIVAVWESGKAGGCKLYVNGERLATFASPSIKTQASAGPVYLGSDAPTTEVRRRGANAAIDDLVILRRAMSDSEVEDSYSTGRDKRGPVEAVAGAWVDEARLQTERNATDRRTSALDEIRAIFHEGIDWALSRAATDKVVARVAAAGFNIYIPCAWYGPGARFPSEIVLADPALGKRLRKGEDPLAYLIETAHRAGLEVHPCLTIARRGSKLFPEFAGPEAPEGTYDLHNPAFRKIMVDLAAEIVRRYPVDGLNLDYIRTIALCSSADCSADYRQRHGRDLLADLRNRNRDPVALRTITRWNTEAVSSLVRDMAKAVRAIRPGIMLSVDAHPNDPALLLQGQDSVAWANQGWIDLIFDMSYNRVIALARLDEVRAMLDEPSKLAIMLANYDRADDGPEPRSAALMSRYIALARERWPGIGLGIYTYPQLTDEQLAGFSNEIFNPRVRAFAAAPPGGDP